MIAQKETLRDEEIRTIIVNNYYNKYRNVNAN